MFQRIRQYLIDSYNGLYKIVLEPYMPKRNTVLAILAGFFIGLIWAYVVSPTVYFNAAPNSLHQDWQNEWVKLLADRFAAANSDVSANIISLLTEVDDPVGIVQSLIANSQDPTGIEQAKFNAILPLAQQAATVGAAQAPNTDDVFGGFIVPWIVAPILLLIVFIAVDLLWNILIYPNIVGPFIDAAKRGFKPDPALEDIKRQKAQIEAEKLIKAEVAKAAASSSRGAPVFQKVSFYQPGRSYDESFAIETADDDFLGECGASISDTIGDEKKVSAVELWIFDKEDFTQTLTKVIAAPGVYNDPAVRAKLDVKGEVFEAKEGTKITFETKTLVMEVTVAKTDYAAGAGIPPNGAFQTFQLQFAAWTKTGQGAAKPAGAVMGGAAAMPPPPMPMPAAPAPMPAPAPRPAVTPLAPPPMGGFSQPAGGGVTPLRTPPPPLGGAAPAPRPAPGDDDPFGGTGDFTPVR